MKVLVTAPYFMPVISLYENRFIKHGIALVPYIVNERATEEELLAVIGDIDGVLCGDDKFTDRVLASAPHLKVIAKWGTGIDSIDQIACANRGIKVLNTKDAFSIPVADSVLGYALSFARNLPWMDRAMKAGTWEKVPGRSMSECVFGIIGVGNVVISVLMISYAL
jgi:D-3-phosphoglycerate dehydrogenase